MKLGLFILLISICNHSKCQVFQFQRDTKKITKTEILKISEDSLHSTFLITIPTNVAPHYHEHHTENIVVLEGKAIMRLGNDTLKIQKGDQITIPQKTIHEVVKVTSKKPLKVYSIQSPYFDGTDRIFVKP